MVKPTPTAIVTKDTNGEIKRVNDDNSRTPIVEITNNSDDPLNVQGTLEIDDTDPIDVESPDNVEGVTTTETWIAMPENMEKVSVMLITDASTEGSVYFSLDRIGVLANSTTEEQEWETGSVTNEILSEEIGRVAGIRLDVTTDNEVAAVPTETVLTFTDSAPTTGDTITFGTEVYEFTTDSTTELTDPANIRIDMDALSITDHTSAAQGFKTVFNAETAYDVTATGAAAAITLTATDNFEAYNDLSTVSSITADATADYEDTTFGGGTGSSTTGVDFVAATLPKLRYIVG
jgi:hypothetical protein